MSSEKSLPEISRIPRFRPDPWESRLTGEYKMALYDCLQISIRKVLKPGQYIDGTGQIRQIENLGQKFNGEISRELQEGR
jgi:hypothetical protein